MKQEYDYCFKRDSQWLEMGFKGGRSQPSVNNLEKLHGGASI